MVRRRRRKRGTALHVVMAVVAVVLVITTTMVTLTTINLEMTTAYANGEIALSEAQAGMARLLTCLEMDETYGIRGEDELRGNVESDGDDTRGYCVTFRTDSEFPFSVNNFDGSQAIGYMGRTVPRNMVHALSTGWCRGQYRTIEAVIDHPPFPYAMATTGRIDSTPLVVKGTTSDAAYAAGRADAPGHIASNSLRPLAIHIRHDPLNPELFTFISGFAQASATIDIEEPAVVRQGIRAAARPVKIPVINIPSFDNGGQPGVAEIVPSTGGAQVLDIMYHCAHPLTYTGGLTLKDAFVYVQGNLTIQGGIKGRGAIVVDGNLRVQGDTTLEAGANQVALLASGAIELQGSGNYLQGMVYGRGGVRASRLTVLGNVIQLSDDPNAGVVLDHVTMVGSVPHAALTFTAHSSAEAQESTGASDLPFVIGRTDSEKPFVGARPHPGNGNPREDTETLAQSRVVSVESIVAFFDGTDATNISANVVYGVNGGDDSMLEPVNELKGVVEACVTLQGALAAAQAALATAQAAAAAADEESAAAAAAAVADAQAHLDQVQAQMDAQKIVLQNTINTFAEAYVKYYRAHTNQRGTYNEFGGKALDITRTYDFTLNKFLPDGAALKVKVWHVYHRRL